MTKAQRDVLETLPKLIGEYGAMRYAMGYHSRDDEDFKPKMQECHNESMAIYSKILDALITIAS